MTDTLTEEQKHFIDDLALFAVNTQRFYRLFALATIETIARARLEHATSQNHEGLRGLEVERFGRDIHAAMSYWKKEGGDPFPLDLLLLHGAAVQHRFGQYLLAHYEEQIADRVKEMDRARPRIAVFLEGGLVTSVTTDIPGGARYVVIDYDTEGSDTKERRLIGQTWKGKECAPVECVPSWVQSTDSDEMLLGFAFDAARPDEAEG